MEELSKIRYLVGKGANQRLKRNVPKDLIHHVGKKTWTERIPNISKNDVKQRANLFALKTEAEIIKYRSQELTPTNENSNVLLSFTRQQAELLAIDYYRSRDSENIKERVYNLTQDCLDYSELLSDAVYDLRHLRHVASGERREVDPYAVKLLRAANIIAEEHEDNLLSTGWPEELDRHDGFQYFCALIEQADIALAERKLKAWEQGTLPQHSGLFVTPIISEVNSNALQDTNTSILLKTLLSRFLVENTNSTIDKPDNRYRPAIRVLLEELGGETYINKIDREAARRIANFLPSIPPHATQHYKGMSLKDAASAYEKTNIEKPANRTAAADRVLQKIRKVFEFAVDEQLISQNPFAKLSAKQPSQKLKKHEEKARTYDSFSIQQLQTIFDMPLYRGCLNDERGSNTIGKFIVRRHRYWAPIIALYTGMRMNEILQLEIEDILQSENGIWYFNVLDLDYGQYEKDEFAKSLKNTSSVRRVPLHPFFE